jgi:hypothetical protein
MSDVRKTIVRGLDGSRHPARVGDPVKRDFLVRDPLTSPTGDLVARRADAGCGAIVQRPDGSSRRLVDQRCIYAVAAWSPDDRKILVMQDVSGLSFTVYAVSVDAPFKSMPVVEGVRVNHPRSWPGRNDVSWQPRVS